ncbi:hypothetical protein [Faecalibacillus intestinalis]|nr:hypothetical protein [Faecalibacillus intestinalis]
MIRYRFDPVIYHACVTEFSKYINFVTSHKAQIKRKQRRMLK